MYRFTKCSKFNTKSSDEVCLTPTLEEFLAEWLAELLISSNVPNNEDYHENGRT